MIPLQLPSKHCNVGRMLAYVGNVMATSCIGKTIDFDTGAMSATQQTAGRLILNVGRMSFLQQSAD